MPVKRKIIDSSIFLLGRILRNRRIKPLAAKSNGSICVNLGCGLSVAPGWINIDASLNALFAGSPEIVLHLLYRLSGANRYYSSQEYCNLLSENTFIFHDLSFTIPFPDNTVNYIYSSHFLEHLFKKDAVILLKEANRVLYPGGIIRVVVPDLNYALELYNCGQKHEMLMKYFFVDDLGSYLARHKYMYDFELLNSALLEAGFSDIICYAYRKGKVPDLDILDNRPQDSIYIEAKR